MCRSNVGMSGGKQFLRISKCSPVQIRHELGHVIGLYHEHTRSDRDDHITIHESNIKLGREINFAKCTRCWHFDLPYGFRSIMHYPKNGMSKHGKATMTPKKVNRY